ncbi:MAG: hypothetical protein K9N07_00050 [Candidatus Cloacimonetes bacterium]|nr:hypothetical protein [Candidatus Cloacimonadota bacterium]
MLNKIYKEYRDIIKKDTPKYLADLDLVTQKMNNSNARYKGEIIDFLYQPMFFEQKDISKFKYIAEMIYGIITKCTNEFITNPDFRKFFGFSKTMEDLILIDPGYKNPAPVARLDIFYDGDFKFCELNGDGTSAMNEANTLEQIFSDSAVIAELRKKYDIRYYELFFSFLSELLKIYREFGGKGKPSIAIADFMGLGSNEEFESFKEAFEQKGHKTIICDPRDMEYRDGKLYVGNFKIDLVYRRAVNKEVELRIEECSDLIQAYKEKAVCVVGPFRSQIMHNKIFFEVLTSEAKTDFLNSQERDFIHKHIPKTFQVHKNNLSKILTDKDNYLLKPKDLYAGKGVICGLDQNKEDWERSLRQAAASNDYLLQKFCNFTQKEITVSENEQFNVKNLKTTLGLFIYNGKFSGLYSRVGSRNVIAGIQESISLPSFVYKPKNEFEPDK